MHQYGPTNLPTAQYWQLGRHQVTQRLSTEQKTFSMDFLTATIEGKSAVQMRSCSILSFMHYGTAAALMR